MLFDLLTNGIFNFRRNRLIEAIDQLKMNFDEVAIPSLNQAHSAFATFETKGRFYVRLLDMFYDRTEMRKQNDFLNDWRNLTIAARQNLVFLEEQVKKTMENHTYSDGISIQKAQLVSAIAAMEYISSNTVTLLALMMISVEDTEDTKNSVTPAVFKEAEEVAKKLFSLLASHGQPIDRYKKLFKEIPDAIVTADNKKQVLASWGKEADPFVAAKESGFVPNFPLMVADTIASLRLMKFNRDKLAKKQMEQRIMYLQSRKTGENTASIEKTINSYEKEVAKLQDKIDNFEQEYGG